LWASTSNKAPLYSDVRYVETLIGPDTVNTLPDETIAAFADHGKIVANSIEHDLDDAKLLFEKLKVAGISINFVTEQLEQDGIQKFIDAYNKLIENLAAKRLKMLGAIVPQQEISAAAFNDELQTVLKSLDEKQVSRRMFDKDAHLWKSDEQEVAAIQNRLGWLTLPSTYSEKVSEFVAFATEIKNEGYKHVVLLGMGGSSLCSEVARETYGKIEGYPELLVLDNTSPDAILNIEKQVELERTLFIVASKSGTTTEPNCFFEYFYGEVEKKLPASAGKNFVAITDDGTPLVKVGEEHKFRKVFINPGDLGGRYSVLSDFGFVPMALAGMDVHAILRSAQLAELLNGKDVPAVLNPGIGLGALLGLAQKKGRDKVTFALSSSIKSFGLWTEQLIAESTGKEGKGLIPVQGE
jgi:transaldolase/glucose-6-phosphate isomerase